MPFTIPESAFAHFYDTPLAFHGTRAPRIEPASRQPSAGGYGARPVDLTVEAMVAEDVVDVPSDAIAPSQMRVFDVQFPASSWKDETPPQIGEWVKYQIPGETLWCKVESVKRLPDGDFAIVATWKPERKPTW